MPQPRRRRSGSYRLPVRSGRCAIYASVCRPGAAASAARIPIELAEPVDHNLASGTRGCGFARPGERDPPFSANPPRLQLDTRGVEHQLAKVPVDPVAGLGFDISELL